MYKIPLNEIKSKIIESKMLTSEELESKIKSKINELSGLISEEGAAHIIANELGIELVKSTESLKIKELYAGMRNVSTVGKVIRKFEVREFNKNNREGKVCSIMLGDETDTIRVVFWNDQVDSLANVNDNDIIILKDVYVKENNGGKEIHFGDKGGMEINPAGVKVETVRSTTGFNRKTIGNLTEEEGVELMGTVVQVFDPRFFLVHPETGKRLQGNEQGITPALSYVMNLVLDDGTGTIRCVFWKEQTNYLLSKKEDEIKEYKENPQNFEDIKTDLLGEQFKLKGRVKRNQMFDRLEFNVQLVQKANPEEELARLGNNS
ncbi:MAG TPA: OB-fold nucleic acid binding domain-containing protein [Candidatus Nanoarchaeia archaeon]|nr:OB-fold nucleic acid binding domain-containing protein [Candidatus Nanoarchaeia archaeon]